MSVNRVTLLGRIGTEPELKALPNGTQVLKMSMATSERYTKDGEKVEKTCWHNLVAFGAQADVLGKYITKGKQLFVEGKIDNRTYDKKDGTKGYVSEVKIDKFTFIGNALDNNVAAKKVDDVIAAGGNAKTNASFASSDIPF